MMYLSPGRLPSEALWGVISAYVSAPSQMRVEVASTGRGSSLEGVGFGWQDNSSSVFAPLPAAALAALDVLNVNGTAGVRVHTAGCLAVRCIWCGCAARICHPFQA